MLNLTESLWFPWTEGKKRVRMFTFIHLFSPLFEYFYNSFRFFFLNEWWTCKQWGCHCCHETFQSLLCSPLILSVCLPSMFQVGGLSRSCVDVSEWEAAGVVDIYCEESVPGPEHWTVLPHELVTQTSPSAHYRWVDPGKARAFTPGEPQLWDHGRCTRESIFVEVID